jgi:hypothetical protein
MEDEKTLKKEDPDKTEEDKDAWQWHAAYSDSPTRGYIY